MKTSVQSAGCLTGNAISHLSHHTYTLERRHPEEYLEELWSRLIQSTTDEIKQSTAQPMGQGYTAYRYSRTGCLLQNCSLSILLFRKSVFDSISVSI